MYKSERGDEDEGDLYPNLSFFLNLNISMEECYKIVDTFKNNKTAGNDGIPMEFYRTFWPIIGDRFLKCANETFVKREMSCSQKQAIISLIGKLRARNFSRER